jgi:Ca2+/H+ antiporter
VPVDGSVWTRKINLFLLGIPVVVFADRLRVADQSLLLAVLAGLALIPLAGFVESGVEELAELLGPFIGGLLHTTFGNVSEVFLAFSVLLTFPADKGAEVVIGSIAGVIIRNSLLFLGLSTFLGCWKNGRMGFNAERAGEYTTVFALAVIGLSLPTLAHFIQQAGATESSCPGAGEELQLFCAVPLSAALAIVLLVSYLAYVLFAVFRFRAGRNLSQAARAAAVFEPALALAGEPDTLALFEQERQRAEEREEEELGGLNPRMERARVLREARRAQRLQRRRAAQAAVAAQREGHQAEHEGRTIHQAPHGGTATSTEEEGETFFERSKSLRGSLALIILAVAIAGVFAMSETFAGGVERIIADDPALGNYEFFLGLVVIPVVGGLVELYGTTSSARENRMELVMATTAGATIQMILLGVPALVLAGLYFGRPLDLVFKPIEVIIFGAATFAFMLLSRDGESSILEGVQLIALWTLLAITALFLPPS